MIILSTESHLVTIDGIDPEVTTENLKKAIHSGFIHPEQIDTVSLSLVPYGRSMQYQALQNPGHYPLKFISRKGLDDTTYDVWCTLSPAESIEALKLMGFEVSEGLANFLKETNIPLILRK